MRTVAFVALVVTLGIGCETPSSDAVQSTRERAEPTMRVERSLVQRGKRVFSERCAVCHGEEAGGTGPVAQAIDPPKPADFRRDRYAHMPADSIRRVVVRGGERTGRNPRMPAWGNELTETEIDAVTAFVRSVGRFGEVPTEQQMRNASWVVD